MFSNGQEVRKFKLKSEKNTRIVVVVVFVVVIVVFFMKKIFKVVL